MSYWEINGRPALVILHMQKGIIGKENGIPGLFEEIEESGIIPRQQELVKAFRSKKLPVIYVNVLNISRQRNPAYTLPAYGHLFGQIEAAKDSIDGLEVINELEPQQNEPVLINWLLGAFTNSGLDQVLKAHHVETVVLAGYATDLVVYNAAVQAVDQWYSVIIPRDACTTRKARMKVHELVLQMMAPAIALVTSTDDVINHI